MSFQGGLPVPPVPALAGRRIVLGVTGSIAAYKAADIASGLVQSGAHVDVIMTAGAARFVTPLTFQSIVHRPVVTDLFSLDEPRFIEHVHLAHEAEVLLIAPATADVISRLAHGRADDALTATALATRAPIVIAPAMEDGMWTHPATQANVARLKEWGVTVVGPESGYLASGSRGTGRLAARDVIIGTVRHVLGRRGDLAGAHLVVTAGGTREAIDPVRHITNRSSGKMGIALAHAARDRGAHVCLITAAPPPADTVGMEVIPVESALDMYEAVGRRLAQGPVDGLIMAAAVADYRPRDVHGQKRKKGDDVWTLELVRNPDILASCRGDFLRVGFAAETNDVARYAKAKLEEKDLDWIVANDVSRAGSGFDVDTNEVTLFSRRGEFIPLPLMPKLNVADRILDALMPQLMERVRQRQGDRRGGAAAGEASAPAEREPSSADGAGEAGPRDG